MSNTGHAAGSERVQLELFGEVVAVENVSVAPGETRRVEFTRSIQAPGDYEATVGNASVSIRVAGDDATTTESTTTTSQSGGGVPGFGVAVALVAVLVAALAAARRET